MSYLVKPLDALSESCSICHCHSRFYQKRFCIVHFSAYFFLKFLLTFPQINYENINGKHKPEFVKIEQFGFGSSNF